MVPGCAGAAGAVTDKFCATDDPPQLFFATTLIVPAVPFEVAEIEAVVELPVQPFGKVHVYEAAPLTGAML